MSEELKSLVETGNKQIEAVRAAVEAKADSATVEAIKTDLTKTLEEKAALERRISALEAEKSRPEFGTKEADKLDGLKSAFNAFLRDPSDENRKAYEAEQKSINITNATNGGIAVDSVIGPQVLTNLVDLSPMRSLARVITVSNEQYIDVIGGPAASGWAGELDVRAATAEPTFEGTNIKFGEVYANVEISNHALNDMFFDVEAFVIDQITREFAMREGLAFVGGDGVKKPLGFATAGNGIATVKSGAAATLGANPGDALINAFYALKGEYRNAASWVMNSRTLASVVSLKDSTGAYLVSDLTAATPTKILGRPVYEDEGIANVAANATPIFVGDFARGYTVADVAGTFNVIKENVTKKGFTTFYVSKRVGGGLALAEAIKGIKIEA